MADLDFLPTWYVSLQRRKRLLKLEFGAVFFLLLCGVAFLAKQRRDISSAQSGLTVLTSQLRDTAAQQKMLDDQVSLRKLLQARKCVLSAIGQPVESSRLLTTLETLMPKEMSFSNFTCTLEATPRPTNVVKLAAAGDQPMDRKLKVKIVGLAPNDMDLANFLTAMTNVSVFQNVIPNYSSPRTESGHILREFEVSFTVDLTPSTPEVAWGN